MIQSVTAGGEAENGRIKKHQSVMTVKRMIDQQDEAGKHGSASGNRKFVPNKSPSDNKSPVASQGRTKKRLSVHEAEKSGRLHPNGELNHLEPNRPAIQAGTGEVMAEETTEDVSRFDAEA